MSSHDRYSSKTQKDVILTHLRSEGLKLLQPAEGYRFSVDSLLLCNFIRLKKREQVLDLGAGCGVIALVLAKRHEGAKVTAIELQRDMAGLAAENIKLNGMDGRVRLIEWDLNRIDDVISAGEFDHVVTNPPYRAPDSGRLCAHPCDAMARHEILTDMVRLLNAARYALRPGGRISLIYPASLTVKLLSAMRSVHLEPKRMQMAYPRPGAQARLVMVEGCKDAGEEIIVLPPIYIAPS
ncbi:MAG: tRNA1(Val) (adenine(37)-N6)-methyltransferase [Dissulfurimicrobium sp.]